MEPVDKQYVQHISGVGEKWEVLGDLRHDWSVTRTQGTGVVHYLPKSEYNVCAPPPAKPKVWKNVTGECEVFTDEGSHGLVRRHQVLCTLDQFAIPSYRLRKVNGYNVDAFLVEREEEA